MAETHRVLVVGAGPAGLAAAFRAAESGLRVTVVDDNPAAGGQIWRGGEAKLESREAQAWFERIRSGGDIQLINGARVFHEPRAGTLLAETPSGVCELNYEKLILATGARERFLPFPGWTLPNVIGAGGLQALVKTGLPIEGKRVVVAGSGPLLLAVAAYLRSRGADVLLIAEQAPSSRLIRFGAGLLLQKDKAGQVWRLRKELSRKDAKSQRRAPRYLSGCWVVGAQGEGKVESVVMVRGGRRWTVGCDYLACGFHLVPNVELAELLGCAVDNDSVRVNEFQETSVPNVYGAGEVTGIGGLELSLTEGEIAGLAAAGKHDAAREMFVVRDKQRRFARLLNQTFALRNELKQLAQPQTIVCRCEDITFERLRVHDSWRAAKLQTRCGMGPCQGRVCGSAVEFLFGWRAESVRPPVLPVRVESLLATDYTDQRRILADE
ncbi:MAG TPA: FAD/NAD(P)-binding oxidoreductase [Pyrinomonadaceae bacterium]|nr:FAD/NAD(P)-binding oxidoreductase [Pyrinomonadaceae bacterium]